MSDKEKKVDELEEFNRAAIAADKETAKAMLAGGVGTLEEISKKLREDIAGFEEQVWAGRSMVNDPKFDELVAMRNYALRWVERLKFYIELDKAGTTAKAAPEKS